MREAPAVFHGYRITGAGLIEFADFLRGSFAQVRDGLEIREVAGHVARILNEADVAGTPRPEAAIFDAVTAHAAHVARIVAGEHQCPLTVASVAVGDDPETGELYALLFSPYRQYGDALDESGWTEYFPYWDDTDADHPDRPRGISTAAWAERGAVWERVLRGADPANPDGLFQIALGRANPDMDLVNRADEVFAALPDMERRIHAALNTLTSAFTSPQEAFEFAVSVPMHVERLRAALKPISLADLVGGAA